MSVAMVMKFLRINCTVVELKHSAMPPQNNLLGSINCTVVELKLTQTVDQDTDGSY